MLDNTEKYMVLNMLNNDLTSILAETPDEAGDKLKEIVNKAFLGFERAVYTPNEEDTEAMYLLTLIEKMKCFINFHKVTMLEELFLLEILRDELHSLNDLSEEVALRVSKMYKSLCDRCDELEECENFNHLKQTSYEALQALVSKLDKVYDLEVK